METQTRRPAPFNTYPQGETMRRLQCALFATAAVIGCASIASAADLPIKGPGFAPAPVPYNWTGIYIGFQGGGSAFGSANESYGLPGPGGAGLPAFVGNQSYNMGGPAAGGVIGADYQFGRTVVGIEADYNWANINGTSGVVNVTAGGLPGLADSFETRMDSYLTVRGRAGYAFGSYDETLVYFDGGGVWSRVTDTYTNPGALTAPNLAAATTNSAAATETGWTIGLGIEYALYWGAHPTNWTVKAEYNYMSLDAPTIQYNAVAANRSTFTINSINVFQLGVNYRFNLGG